MVRESKNMKSAALFCALLATSLAVPNGYYREQSHYQSSSSSFKNNQLQHKTDDESFYAKHGDLEGRTEPKVNSYSQHLEYQNPNRGHDTYASDLSQRTEDAYGSYGSSNVRQTQDSGRYVDSSGRYTDSYGSLRQMPEDLHGAAAGTRKQYSYSGSYSVSGGNANLSPIRGGHYDTPSRLQSITQQLQDDLSTQLQTAIAQQHQSSYSSSTVESNMRQLERELKANLTRELKDKLSQQYGIQGKRGAYSYSITAGNYNPQANYNNQELDDLTAELQRNLMQQLETGVRNEHSQSNRYQSSYGGSRGHTTMYRPRPQTYEAPRINPSVPLLDVTAQVQNDLDREVNTALHNLELKYLVEEYHDQPDYTVILEDLKNQLRRNLTTMLDEALTRTYGRQEQRGEYFFNVGSATANYKDEDLSNLKEQIENNLIKKLTKVVNEQTSRYSTRRTYGSHVRPTLHRQTESQTYRYHQTVPSNQEPIYNPNRPNTDDQVYTSYVTFRPQKPVNQRETYEENHRQYGENHRQYEENIRQHPERNTYRPNQETNSEVEDLRTDYDNSRTNSKKTDDFQYTYNPTGNRRPAGSGPETHTSSQSQSQSQSSESAYSYGTRNSGIEIVPNSQVELVNIQRELQNDLSRQIQEVIRQQREQSHSSTTYVPANSVIVTELSEELKRNLTQKLQEVLRQHYGRQGTKGGYAFTVTTSGAFNPKANYNVEQITDLTNQVQEDLLRQLREGLTRQSYQYTQTSSSSSYKPMVGYGSYGLGSSSYGSGSSSYSNRYVSGSNKYGTAHGQLGYSQGTSELDSDCMQNDDNFTKNEQKIETKPLRGDQKSNDDTPVDLEVTPEDDVSKPLNPAGAAQTLIDTERKDQQIEDDTQFFGQQQQTDLVFGEQHELAQHTEDQHQDGHLIFGQDLSQQTENQQPIRLQTAHELQTERNFRQKDLQLVDLSQQTEENFQPQRLGDLSQQTEDDFQLEHYSQQESHNQFEQQQFGKIQTGFDDLSQQHEDQFNQHFEDLSQKVVDDEHLNVGSPLFHSQHLQKNTHQTQKLEDLTQTQKLEDLTQTQKLEDLTQQTINGYDGLQQTQKLEDLTQQTINGYDGLQQTQLEDLTQTQKLEDLTQQTINGYDGLQQTQKLEDLTQQTINGYDGLQQTQLEDLTQQTVNGFEGLQQTQQNTHYNSYQSHSQQSSYSASNNKTYSLSHSSHPVQTNYGFIHQIPVEQTADLEQKTMEKQVANVVQDVSHQAQIHSDVHNLKVESLENPTFVNSMGKIETTTVVQDEGFWKRLGSKITNTYNKAKDKITEKIG